MERVPPLKEREKVDRELRVQQRSQPRNTAHRFRFQTLWARWLTLCTYWDRVTREVEEGTYRRDLQRIARKRKERAAAEATRAKDRALDGFNLEGFDVDFEAALDGARAFAEEASTALRSPPAAKLAPEAAAPPVPAQQAAPPPRPPVPPRPQQPPSAVRPPAPPVPPPPKPSTSGSGEDRLQQLYSRYVATQKQVGDGSQISFEKLSAQVKKMEPELKQKYGATSVDFEVVVKDGRVGLKPNVKK